MGTIGIVIGLALCGADISIILGVGILSLFAEGASIV